MQVPTPKAAAAAASAALDTSRSALRPATAPAPQLPQTGFLRQWQVLAFVPISKSTLWRRVQVGSFPEPVKLSTRITVWRAEDLRRWIDAAAGAAAPPGRGGRSP
ncbi:MAG TPA: AlpA family phage regulatory protein [Rubrivivax sp.]|nr:AlpA family phage regulatory protein [Rubrivivax sp.]